MMTLGYEFKIENIMGLIGNMIVRVYVLVKEKDNINSNLFWAFHLNTDYEVEMRFFVDRNC